MQYAPTLTVDCMGSFCQSSDLDAPLDVPVKGTNAGARLFRRVICLGRPGSTVPVCGAYAVAPYVSGFYFLTVRVGRNSIRPIRCPRKGGKCGFWVVSMGYLLGSPGLYRARLWGVCNTPLRLRSLFFDRQGRGVLHTPHQTSLSRGRMRVPGYFAGLFIGGVRALSCPFVGRMQYAPTLPVDCMGSFCQPSDLDAPLDVSVKGTNAGARLFRRAIYWGRPGPTVPDCRAYAIRPYPDGRLYRIILPIVRP